jgi:hypothetical protein
MFTLCFGLFHFIHLIRTLLSVPQRFRNSLDLFSSIDLIFSGRLAWFWPSDLDESVVFQVIWDVGKSFGGLDRNLEVGFLQNGLGSERAYFFGLFDFIDFEIGTCEQLPQRVSTISTQINLIRLKIRWDFGYTKLLNLPETSKAMVSSLFKG